jgi:competence protein ComEA
VDLLARGNDPCRNKTVTYAATPGGTLPPMATSSERRALVFLAGVVFVGAMVRVTGDRSTRSESPSGALALHRRSVDSVASARLSGRTARTSTSSERVNRATSRKPRRQTPRRDSATAASVIPRVIDLDRAPAKEIELLPRIGPALAERIVRDRDSNGAFGSLAGLERVRGVGPALASALEGRVTFSGTARPSNAVAPTGVSSSQPRRRPARKSVRRP